MIRTFLFIAAVACVFSGCAHSAPHKRGPQRNPERLSRLVAARNTSALMRLRRERDERNRTFFDSRVAQARMLAAAGAYEAALLVLNDTRHFATMTFGSPKTVAALEAKPRSYTNMHLGVLSYDRKQYSLAKAQWRDALARAATQPAAERSASVDTKRALDLLRFGGDFNSGPTPAQDEAMQQMMLAPDPPAPKRKHSIFDELFKHAGAQLHQSSRPQHILDVLPEAPKPSPTPSPKPAKKRRHKFLGIF
ncbi:MAG: hypothetical protein ACXVAR_05165 [Vulcanimicrobiaceae bacterium]